MLVVRGIGPNQAGYYWHDPGEPRWLGAGLAALGHEPTLDARSLAALLDGVDPVTGELLAPRRAHRRAGWDLVFAAPKSVSLLAALAPAEAANDIRQAHAAAVEGAVGFFEARAAWARRGKHGTVRSEVDGVVAARFTHAASAAGEPHLHAHVVLVNLAPAPDGQWAALAANALWPAHQAIGSAYQLGLRHYLARLGFSFEWALGTGGGADVVGVPAAAIQAASSRRVAIAAERAGQEQSAAARQVAAHQLARRVPHDSWQARAQAAGFGLEQASRLTSEAGRPRIAAVGPNPRAVEAWLEERSSTFGPLRVVVALAATTPAGMDARVASAWADHFCAAAIPAPGRRVTTSRAVAADRTLLEAAARGIAKGVGVAPAWAGRDAPPGVERLLRSGDAVEVLRAAPARDGPLVAQAAVVDMARKAWQATGYRVAVLAPSPRAAARWEALTGLPAWSPTGEATMPPTRGWRGAPEPGPDVLVVDRADRMTTRQLAELTAQARPEARKILLVEGGTLSPARHARSAGFATLAGRAPALDVLPPGLIFGAAIDRWAEERASGRDPVLVGLGPAEVGALNAAAHQRLLRGGTVGGPVFEAYGRAFQAGDRVLALRQGAGPSGAVGTVVEVAGRRGLMWVDWGDGRPVPVQRFAAGRLGQGYATTPGYLSRVPGPIVALAQPGLLRGHRHRLVDALTVSAQIDPPTRVRSTGLDLGL